MFFSLVALGACGNSRKPLPHDRDAGPSVVVVDRRTEPKTHLPSTPEVEPNDKVGQAQPVEAGARISGKLAVTPADVDCFALPGPPTPDLGAPLDGGTPQPRTLGFVSVELDEGTVVLDLLSDKGKIVASRTAALGQHVTLSFLALPAVVRVRRPKGNAANPAAAELAYTLEYTTRTFGPDEDPQPEVEPDDQALHAVPLPAHGVLTGRLDGGDDRDLVALPALPTGATYRVELAAIAEVALEVKLRSGNDVLSTARGGKGGELRLRNLPGSTSAPLYLQLRAIDGASDTPYTLRVGTEPALDAGIEHEPNDDRAHANAVTPGSSIAGYLWPSDNDWFCAADATSLGAHVDGMADVDWKLELTDAAGVVLAKADAGKPGAAEALTPDPRGRCVHLSARTRDTAFDAPYKLTFVP